MPEEPTTPENNQTPVNPLEPTETTPETPPVAPPTNPQPEVQSQEGETEPLAPASDPSSATPDHSPRPWLQEQPKKSKKGLFITLGVLLALAIVGGGGWAAYALWYQNPDKVIMDALASSLTARTVSVDGTFGGAYAGSDTDATLSVKYGYKEGGSLKGQATVKLGNGVNLKLDGEGVYAPNGDGYGKLNNLGSAAKALYDSSIQAYFGDISKLPAQYQEQIKSGYDLLFAPTVKKVDGKWIKVTAADFKESNAKAGEQYECFQKVVKNLQNDNKDLLEVGSVYQKDKFIVIKENLGVSNGSMGFVIDVDKDVFKRFTEDIKTTKLYKDLKACSSDGKTPFDDSKIKDEITDSTSHVELWVDQWSHKITRINGTSSSTVGGNKSTSEWDFKTQFDAPVTVTVPKADLTLKDIIGDVKKLVGNSDTSATQSSSTSADSASLFGTGVKA